MSNMIASIKINRVLNVQCKLQRILHTNEENDGAGWLKFIKSLIR
jgi:hypothetical protein